MTIGKVTKKDSRYLSRTHRFMKKSTDNLTLKDFAELIEFMNEADNRSNNAQQGRRQASRSVLGLGHFLNSPRTQASRLNNQGPAPTPPRQPNGPNYRRNDFPAPPEPAKKRDNEEVHRDPMEPAPPGQRVTVEYIEQ